jgi:predicted neuraminidase
MLRTLYGSTLGLALLAAAAGAQEAAPSFESGPIFPPDAKHNHASCVVELANGDLLVAWYSGSGERQADDVRILGARRKAGESGWSAPFEMADTPGYPDCNPALFAAPDGSVWLWWPTILDHRWEGALLKYRKAADGGTDGPPAWTESGVVHVTPSGFGEAMEAAMEGLNGAVLKIAETYFDQIRTRSKDELYQRLGWMPRVHPTVLPSGRWLLPLYSDTFSCSMVLRSDDKGATWAASTPIIGFGNIQPSLVRREDGTVVAYMRENGPRLKVRVSESRDEGVTWGPVTESPLPNPGAGVEAIRLASGAWAMVYNDTVMGRHSLAVSLSDDEGRTWPVTRHVERSEPRSGSYHYPSILQARDGSIHVTYTRSDGERSTIQHARFDEAWVRAAR